MDIECVVEKLNKVVQQIHHITGKNLTLPILSTIFLKTENNSLILKTTNLDLGVEIRFPCRVVKSGEVAVPADVFSAFLSTISNEQKVNLRVDKGVLMVDTSINKTKITTFPTDDFPQIPHIKGDNKFSIKTNDLINGLKSVVFSSSNSSIKPELSSVYIYTNEDGRLVFVATDSFRLAEKNIDSKKVFFNEPLLLPSKNILSIIRVLEQVGEDVEVVVENNQIAFINDGLYLTSRVVDGIFPDYKKIIPKEFDTKVILLKEDLIKALKVVNIFSNNLNRVVFNVNPTKNIFEIITKNPIIGETTNSLNATLEGSGVEVAFNYKYIIDCFSSIPVDSISLSFSLGNKPMVIEGVGDKTFLYLVMPMNS